MSTVSTTPAPVGVRIGARSALVLAVASVLGLLLFTWPLLVPLQPGQSQSATAPFAFAALLPVIVVLVLVQVSDGGMDTRALAMLGVLSAVNAAIRPALGAGTAGIESVFFTLILAGRAFGPGFGFALGCTSMFASALLTAGVGPWLPFQMIAAAWIGLGAGLLPGGRRDARTSAVDSRDLATFGPGAAAPAPERPDPPSDAGPELARRSVAGKPLPPETHHDGRRRAGLGEVALLVAYGVVASYAFGLLLNLSFWPTLSPAGSVPAGLDYVPGAPLAENLRRFTVFTLVTSTAGWDTGRAITTALALAVLGRPVLDVFHRAARRSQL